MNKTLMAVLILIISQSASAQLNVGDGVQLEEDLLTVKQKLLNY